MKGGSVALDMRPSECGANSEGSPFDVFLFLRNAQPAWMRRAACKGHPPEWWWPEANDNPTRDRAQGICAKCPVRADCLEYGLSRPKEVGILGGLTERQRKALRRQLRRHPHLGPQIVSDDDLDDVADDEPDLEDVC